MTRIAQGRIELLDHPQTIRELAMLERRPRPGGKDVVEHPRGGHDDYANALALAAAHASTKKRADPTFISACLGAGAEITPFASAPLATAGLRYAREGHDDDD